MQQLFGRCSEGDRNDAGWNLTVSSIRSAPEDTFSRAGTPSLHRPRPAPRACRESRDRLPTLRHPPQTPAKAAPGPLPRRPGRSHSFTPPSLHDARPRRARQRAQCTAKPTGGTTSQAFSKQRTPTTSRAASVNEIKSLKHGRDSSPITAEGARCCGGTTWGDLSSHQGPPAACPDRLAGRRLCAHRQVTQPLRSSPHAPRPAEAAQVPRPLASARGSAALPAASAAAGQRPWRPRPARQASGSGGDSGQLARGESGSAAGTPRPPAPPPLTGGT